MLGDGAGKRQAAPGEGAVLEVMQWGSLLLYATQRGGIHAWDLRADTNAWTLPTTSNQARPPQIFWLASPAIFKHRCLVQLSPFPFQSLSNTVEQLVLGKFCSDVGRC